MFPPICCVHMDSLCRANSLIVDQLHTPPVGLQVEKNWSQISTITRPNTSVQFMIQGIGQSLDSSDMNINKKNQFTSFWLKSIWKYKKIRLKLEIYEPSILFTCKTDQKNCRCWQFTKRIYSVQAQMFSLNLNYYGSFNNFI